MSEMKPRKKILFLITKSNWGGAQRYVYDLATSLDRETFEPVVALGGDGPLVEMFAHAHVRTISINSLQRDISISKEFVFAKELASILRSEKPHVLHVNSSKAGGVGTVLGRLFMVPRVIYTAHGWAFNEARPWWQKIIVKVLHWITVLFSHKTIAVSSAIAKQLQWLFIKNKFIVINPGRTIGPMYGKKEAREKLADIFPTLQTYLQHKWIITIAELHPIKRQDVLIKAMEDIVAQHQKTIAVCIGEGENRTDLEQQIEKAGLTEHVLLPGAVTEAARFLKAADIFTLTSDSESYGYVIHEAGIAGVPVIATDVGGVRDIITNENEGVLISASNHHALVNEIDAILTDNASAKERAQNLQQSLSKRTKESMTRATETVYELPLK